MKVQLTPQQTTNQQPQFKGAVDSGLRYLATNQAIGANGFRHHVSLAKGRYESALREAFGKYLGYELADIGG